MKNKWAIFYALRMVFHKFKRYQRGMISLTFSYITLLLIGFLNTGVNGKLEEEIYKKGDAYSFTLYKKINQDSSSSLVGITRTLSPSFSEAQTLERYIPSLSVELNYEFLFPLQMLVEYQENSFMANVKIIKSFDRSLIKEGTSWRVNNDEGILINQSMKERLKSIDENVLYNRLFLHIEKNISFEEKDRIINDVFLYEKHHEIIGIIEEFSWQNQPMIYLSFDYVNTYLKNHYLYHLSLAKGEIVTWYQFLLESDEASIYRSFSLWLFVDNKEDVINTLSLFQNLNNSPYILESHVQETYLLFDSITKIITWTMEIMIIFISVIIGAIVGYLTTIHLIQDENDLGILYALGGKSKEISFIYLSSIFIVNLIALMGSMIVSLFLGIFINAISLNSTDMAFLSFSSSGFILATLFIFTSILLLLITKIVVHRFSKKDIDLLIREI